MTKRPECFSKILSLLFAAVILFMVFPSAAAAADFTLGWNPNQEEDLSGYKIHYKEKSYGEPRRWTQLFGQPEHRVKL